MLPAGSSLARVYFRGTNRPAAWDEFRVVGPLNGRFDHHRPPSSGRKRKVRLRGKKDRGILYVATSAAACLAEVFQDTRVIDRVHNAPWLVIFDTAAPLALLDLAGRWPTRAGASGAIATGRRDYARQWSRAIYDSYPDIHGLLYRSSMDPKSHCLALYERVHAAGALPQRPRTQRALSDPLWDPALRAAGRELGYAVV